LLGALRPWEEGGHREVVRSGPLRGLESVDEVFLALRRQAGLTRLRGLQGPFGRVPESPDEGACSGPRGLGGSRTQGVIGEDSRGGETQERIGRQDGATRTGRERTRRGIKASKQMKLAEQGGSAAWSPEQPGSGLRSVERALIAAGGARRPRESVGVGETRGDKADGQCTPARRWITAGEQAASRGVR